MERQRGFTYLALLMAIALLGLGAVAVSEVWVATARRQNIEELDWRGAQIVQAIGSYFESSPGGARVYPASLDDLVEDGRFMPPRHHLRRKYTNPLAADQGWELVVGADQRVRGVRAKFDAGHEGGAVREFIYVPAIR